MRPRLRRTLRLGSALLLMLLMWLPGDPGSQHAVASTLFDESYPEGAEVRIDSGPPVDLDVAQVQWTSVPNVPGVRYVLYQEYVLLAFTGTQTDRITTDRLTAPERLVFDWTGSGVALKKAQAVTFPKHNLLEELRTSTTGGVLRTVLETGVPLPVEELADMPAGWRVFWIGTRFEIRMQRTITPHVVYLKRVMVDATGQRRVHTVRANLKASGFEPVVVTASDLNRSWASVRGMLEHANGYVAINGGFFDKGGRPQGLIVRDGLLKNQPVMDRPSLAMNHEGRLAIGFLPVIGRISGERALIEIERINGHYTGQEPVLLSPGHPGRLADEGRLTDAWKVVIEQSVVRRAGFEPLTQEERQLCHVLLVPPALVNQAHFIPGEIIRANYQVGRTATSVIDLALQAGPMLVRDGAPYVSPQGDFPADIRRGRAPRSAIGLTANGDLILMAVDGRSKTAAGATLDELAVYLIEAGAHSAMNLDGGSSTQLVIAGDLVTQSATGPRGVANALVLVDRHGRFGRQDFFF